MKTKLFLTLILLTLSVGAASAQTYPRSTTLAANLTANATVVSVASGTGVQANGAFMIDAEFIPINVSNPCANAACTLVNVTRVAKPLAHASGRPVTVISAAARPITMLTQSAAWRVGQCSTSSSSSPSTALAAYSYLPFFDIDTGLAYNCRRGTGGVWEWVALDPLTVNTVAGSVATSWP